MSNKDSWSFFKDFCFVSCLIMITIGAMILAESAQTPEQKCYGLIYDQKIECLKGYENGNK